jgi:hypothetical protein
MVNTAFFPSFLLGSYLPDPAIDQFHFCSFFNHSDSVLSGYVLANLASSIGVHIIHVSASLESEAVPSWAEYIREVATFVGSGS